MGRETHLLSEELRLPPPPPKEAAMTRTTVFALTLIFATTALATAGCGTNPKYNPGYSTIVDKTPDSDPLVANGHRIGVVIVEGEDDENGNPLPPLLCGYDLDESPNLRTSSAGQAFFANTGSGGECFPLAVAMTPGKHPR